jgi:2-methylcitrate dehydratase PrpD
MSEAQYTRVLAQYLAGAADSPLREDVQTKGRQLILDTLGSMIAGSHMPSGQVGSRALGRFAGPGTSSIAGRTDTVDPVSAAFINGIQAHSDELDDSHFATLTHPAAVTVPTALALAEHTGASGRAVLTAVAAGYDAQCRVALALDPRALMRRGFMPLSVCASFGAAASGAVMLRLDTDGVEQALGLAGLQACGLWACANEGTHMAKAIASGAPVRNGVTCALLVSAGFAGPPAIFEGPDGVLKAFSDSSDPEPLTDALGERFEILLTSIKKHTCGGPIRGAVDGLFELMDAHALDAEDLENVTVHIARTACYIVDNRPDPAICLQYVVAVAAIDRVVNVRQVHSPDRVEADDVRLMQQRVTLIPDDEYEKVWPHQRPTRISIRTRDGRTFQTVVTDAIGSHKRPMTDDQVREKFRVATGDVIAPEIAESIVDVVAGFDSAEDVRRLGELLRATAASSGGSDGI